MAKTASKTVLLTVGSTQFAPLVKAALQEQALTALADAGYTHFIVQYGKQDRPSLHGRSDVQVELHAFLGDIEERMQQVDLVLSHAGVCAPSLPCIISACQCCGSCSPTVFARCWIDLGSSTRSSSEPVSIAKEAHRRAKRHAHGCAPV